MKKTGAVREKIAAEIISMRAAVRMLEAHFKAATRQHKKLNLGRCGFDPFEYYSALVMMKAAKLRAMLDKPAKTRPVTLADESVLVMPEPSGRPARYQRLPLKYSVAVCNNPDDTLSPEELKIRYMPMGKCGR